MEVTEATEATEKPLHEVIETMTHMMNYLSVSLYESQFTKNHEDSYTILRTIYDSVAARPYEAPLVNDVKEFYNNIVYLGSVTYTEDPDYYTYKRKLRKYFTFIYPQTHSQ
jgi:hypothetical protein